MTTDLAIVAFGFMAMVGVAHVIFRVESIDSRLREAEDKHRKCEQELAKINSILVDITPVQDPAE